MVVCAEEERDGVPANTASVDSSVNGRLEDVIWEAVARVDETSGRRKQRERRTCPTGELVTEAAHTSIAGEMDDESFWRSYLITSVPGMGGASIHWFCLFRTWSAWIPGSCHKIVKHCVLAPCMNLRSQHR